MNPTPRQIVLAKHPNARVLKVRSTALYRIQEASVHLGQGRSGPDAWKDAAAWIEANR